MPQRPTPQPTKALIAGWFSFEDGHATGGDLLARDVLCNWLDELDIRHVTAVAPPFTDGVPFDKIVPSEITHAFFVCGPFGPNRLEADFLEKFAHCRLVGLNLSLDCPTDKWQPFDLLIERDSSRRVNADIVFASISERPPVVGVCLVEPHPEADVALAHGAIARLLHRHAAARVPIDTRLDNNSTGLRSKDEIVAVIGRMDAIVTTRLHGLVMALNNGVPALAIDAVPGGGKISKQCALIGWPNVLGLDELSPTQLDAAFAFALTEDARKLACECADRALRLVDSVKTQLAAELQDIGSMERHFAARQGADGMNGSRALGTFRPRPLQALLARGRGILGRAVRRARTP